MEVIRSELWAPGTIHFVFSLLLYAEARAGYSHKIREKKIENSKPRALSFSPYIISGVVMTQRYLCCLGASSPEGVGVGTFAGSQANTSLEERAVTFKGKGKD